MTKEKIRIYRLDVGSCNGCDVEVFSILSTQFDLDKLNAEVVKKPEEANLLLVTGVPTIKMQDALKEVHEKIQDPKAVVAIGTCAITRGVFKESYTSQTNVDEIIPVNAYAFGCPPDPQIIYRALGDLLEKEFDVNWPVPQEFRGFPRINQDKCTACGACVEICPADAIDLKEDGGTREIEFIHEDCVYCAACELICPEDAIELEANRMETIKEKEESRASAKIEMQECGICGEPFTTTKQIDRSLERILEKVPNYEELKDPLSEAMCVCPDCRNNIQQIKNSKNLLLRLAEAVKSGQ